MEYYSLSLCVYIVRKTEKRINRILWVCVLYIVSCLYLEITFLISSKNIALPVASRNEFSVFKGNRHVSDFRFVFVILARKKKKKNLINKNKYNHNNEFS